MGEQQEYYIGLDIGGTKCAVTLGKFEGDDLTIVDKIKFATNPEELQRGKRAPSEVLDEFVLQTQRLLAKHNGAPKRVGISCGGPLDSKRGIVLSPPNLPGWDRVEVVAYFSSAFGVECVLQNDANACAVAEWMFGAGKGTQNMIFLTFGTGLGAGLILDGRLYSGTSDMAGEIGHVRCEEDLSAEDRRYMDFGREFEERFLSQSYDENRSITETLDLGWKLLAILGADQLDRIDPELIQKYGKI